MPRSKSLVLVWSPTSRADLIRLRQFIARHNPEAAKHVAQRLKKAAHLIVRHPGVGSRLNGRHDRELFVPFGQRGYVIRYRISDEAIVILKIWHERENKEIS